MQPKYLGVDVGGTKIELCLFDTNYELVENYRAHTADYNDGQLGLIHGLRNLIREHWTDSIQKIGVSFNCSVNNNELVYSSLLGGPVAYPLGSEFSKEFGVPTAVENDVNAMAIAESNFGLGKKAQSFLLINLGTGIRTSSVVDGNLIGGYKNNAGELSMMEIVVPELNNISLTIDNLICGRGVARIYQEITGEEKTAKEVFAMCDSDADAKKTVDIFTKHFAHFLQQISFMYNPQRVILNGSLKKEAKHYLENALAYYRKNTMEFFHFEDIVLSTIDHGAALGAVISNNHIQ